MSDFDNSNDDAWLFNSNQDNDSESPPKHNDILNPEEIPQNRINLSMVIESSSTPQQPEQQESESLNLSDIQVEIRNRADRLRPAIISGPPLQPAYDHQSFINSIRRSQVPFSIQLPVPSQELPPKCRHSKMMDARQEYDKELFSLHSDSEYSEVDFRTLQPPESDMPFSDDKLTELMLKVENDIEYGEDEKPHNRLERKHNET